MELETNKKLLRYGVKRLILFSLLIIPSIVLNPGPRHFILADMSSKDNHNLCNPLGATTATLLPICRGIDGFVSLKALYQFCNVPSPCDFKMNCEGKIAKVKGYIDYSNVFDKKKYPKLPYEKFKIFSSGLISLEIWVASDNGSKIFDKIYANNATPDKMVFIKGEIVGFDMPSEKSCQRGIKINLENENDLFFK